MASLAVGTTLPPRGEQALTFLLTWHFSNRLAWLPQEVPADAEGNPNWVGNYYTTLYRDA